jgi:hypothetical protein
MTPNLKKLLPASRRGALGLIVLLNLLIFGVVLSYDFLFWDDPISVTQNEKLLEDWSLEKSGWLINAHETLRLMPIVWVLRKCVLLASGLNPAVFHSLNLFFHLAAACLLFLLTNNLLRRLSSSAQVAILGAFITTLLWAVHPLRVEPVAWVTAQSYPIATTLTLASLFCLERSWGTSSRQSLFWIIGMFLAALLSILAYPTALFTPLALLVLSIYALFSRFDEGSCLTRGVTFSLHALLLLATALILKETYATNMGDNGELMSLPGSDQSSVTRMVSGIRNYGYYMASLVFPFQTTPARFYPESTEYTTGEVILWIGAFLSISLLTFWSLRRAGMLIAILASWLVITIPMLGLSTTYIIPTDRHSYLTHAILWVVVAVATTMLASKYRHLFQRYRTIGIALVSLFAVTCIWRTATQIGIWKDNIALYSHMMSVDAEYDFKVLVKILTAREFKLRNEDALAEAVFADIDPRQIQSAGMAQRAAVLSEWIGTGNEAAFHARMNELIDQR